jgi:hypothetical protein
MGCACNNQELVSENNNEMREGRNKSNKANNNIIQNNFLFFGENHNQNIRDDIQNSLKNSPILIPIQNSPISKNPQKEVLTPDNRKDKVEEPTSNIVIKKPDIKEEISFTPGEFNENYQEINTDKISDTELDELFTQYPYQDDGVILEKRNPQEHKQEKIIYYGEWDKNKNVRHGRGIQIWPDGAKYIGNWKNDKACGKGKLYHPDGDIYEGDWDNDKPNGYGIYTHSDGTRYEGEWEDDKQNGKGKELWPDGAVYEGDYKNGQKNGYGKFSWIDGSVYTGQFKDNNINGEGTYNFADGRKYVGSWANNKLDGNGIFTWPNGRKYDGEYVNDRKEGFGIFEWPNGKKYKGYWKQGKQDGEGEFYFPSDNRWRKGIWENGKRIQWCE